MLDESLGHGLVIGPTGSGKTRHVAIANCLWFSGPLFALDVKGELAAVTARHRAQQAQDVVVLDPFGLTRFPSASLNPLDLLESESEGFVADCWMLARLITGGQLSLQDRFWDQCAEALIAGTLAYFARWIPQQRRDLAGVREFLCDADLSYRLAVLLDGPLAKETGLAADEFKNFLAHEGEKVRTSVRSTAMQHLSIFTGVQVERATATSSFDLASITEGRPVSIYVVMAPHRLDAYAALVRLWFATVITLITRRRRATETPTLFLLDEVAQLGAFPLLRSAVTLLRGFGVRCLLFLQDLSQLRQLFPTDCPTIINNCSSFVTLGHTSFAMAREMSDLLGDIGAEALFRMDRRSLAVRRDGAMTEIVDRIDFLSDPLFAGRYDPNPFVPVVGS